MDIDSEEDERESAAVVSSTQGVLQARLARTELYGVLDSKVVGVQYYRGIASAGEYVTLIREAHNQIGHIPRTVAARLAKYIDEGSLLVEGTLASGLGVYDCALSLSLYGPSDPEARAEIKEDMKRNRLPTQIVQKREREVKKRQADELRAASKRAKSKDSSAMVQGETQGDGQYSQSLDDIVEGSQRFDPREATEKFGIDEQALADMSMADAPPQLATRMLDYQRQALAWLLEREDAKLPAKGSADSVQMWKRMAGKPNTWTNIATNFSIAGQEPQLARGGILSDDMGLGKTLEMISLLLANKSSKPTLIVAPVGLMSNWSGQIEQHIKPESALKVYRHHGSTRKSLEAGSFTNYDVVITSYGTLTTEHFSRSEKGLCAVQWRRVILDEGHTIRNPQTKSALAATALHADSKWVLTGTPVINSLIDLYSLVRFVGLTGGLEQLKIFNSVLIRPLKQGDSNASLLLQTLMATVCLRRKKEMAFVNLGLPPLTEYVHRVELSAHEKEKYSALQAEAKGLLKSVQGGKSQEYRHLLEVLLRLRQICNHWQLCGDRVANVMAMLQDQQSLQLTPENRLALQSILQLSIDQREDCPICLESLHSPVITTCAHTFGFSCIERIIEMQHKCPMCRASPLDLEHLVRPSNELGDGYNSAASTDVHSSKTNALLKILVASLKKEPMTKTVVFSQWTSFLDIIQARLEEARLGKLARIDGSMKPAQRDAALQRFIGDDECPVILASLAVCSVGLNLVAANQVILADSWWAPAIEDQAVDRVHRLGQKRPTTVWRIVVEGTVEDSVLEIQAEKRRLMSLTFADKGMQRGQGKISHLADIERLLA